MYEYALIGVVLAVLMYAWKKNSSTMEVKLPPGPEPTLVIGNFKDIDTDRVRQSLHKISQQFGPIAFIRLLSRNIVVLNTTEAIRTAFYAPEFREHLNDKAKGFYGTYLVYNHAGVLLGPYTKTTFKLKDVIYKGVKPSMAPTQIAKELSLLVEIFQRKIGTDFCPREMIEKQIAEVTTIMLTGEVMDGDAELMWDFVNWSNKLLNPPVETLMKHLPFLRHLPGKPGLLYNTTKEKRDILLARVFGESRTTYVEGTNRGLVDICIGIQQTEERAGREPWLTDDMIKALILDTIGAGIVATANSILASILNLLHHKDCVRKMKTEINTVLGRTTLPVQGDEERLPYCYAVVLETQRYSTIVPIVSHYCTTKDLEFEGFTIAKGTMIWGNIWSAHHEDKSWSDPWTFQPERFLDEEGKLLPKEDPIRKNIIPLGIGPRDCVGRKFAMVRLFTYITTIVQHFDILSPNDSELKSCDPNLYTAGAVLQLRDFTMRVDKSS